MLLVILNTMMVNLTTGLQTLEWHPTLLIDTKHLQHTKPYWKCLSQVSVVCRHLQSGGKRFFSFPSVMGTWMYYSWTMCFMFPTTRTVYCHLETGKRMAMAFMCAGEYFGSPPPRGRTLCGARRSSISYTWWSFNSWIKLHLQMLHSTQHSPRRTPHPPGKRGTDATDMSGTLVYKHCWTDAWLMGSMWIFWRQNQTVLRASSVKVQGP